MVRLDAKKIDRLELGLWEPLNSSLGTGKNPGVVCFLFFLSLALLKAPFGDCLRVPFPQ